MESFLKNYFSSIQNLKIEQLKGDGGHRSYHRIQAKDKAYILMDSGLNDSSLKDFIFWQKELKKANSLVPEIFESDVKKGLLLLEDLGDVSLEEIFYKKKNYKELYFKSIENLILMQKNIKQSENVSVKFDFSFLKEESSVALQRLKLFFEKRNLPFPDPVLFQKEMQSICKEIHSLPFAFCHRDYHSRNLMIKNEEPYAIDFQDAGYGPYCYDITSLVFDSYVPLSSQEQRELISFYFKNFPSFLADQIQDEKTILYHSKLLFLQRGFKACGCFVGFDTNNNKKTHLPFVKPTLQNLEKESEKLSYKNLNHFFKSLNKEFIL